MTNKHPQWLEDGWQHIWMPYAQMQTTPLPQPVVRADGCTLHLADGRTLVDGLSSWWSACHGHNHPHIQQAVQKQLEQLPHTMFAGLAHEQAFTLATRLCKIVPEGLTRVFFSDSGSTAVEVALKMALQYWRNKGDARKTKFVCFNHAYHGDTFGAMSVSARSGWHSAYDSLVLKNYSVDIPHDEYSFAEFEDTMKAIAPTVAGLIVEPLVQGAGGMRFYSADILAEIRRVCREHNILFIADEIATGFGRTGTMFACNEAGISPDIICLGKALTGGTLTLGATIATHTVFEAFLGETSDKALMHGPTYMANPLACTAANASLDLFEREPRAQQVEQIEQWLNDGLRELANIKGVQDVRVKGAIGVVQLDCKHEDIIKLRPRFIEHGVWVRPFGDIIYLTPPFVISEQDTQTLTQAVSKIVREWS